MVMPDDALNSFGIRYSDLKTLDHTEGIGGSQRVYVELATLTFLDNGGLCMYSIDLQICEDSEETRQFPSVLGRDIIDNWRITYSKPELDLYADVIHAHRVIARS